MKVFIFLLSAFLLSQSHAQLIFRNHFGPLDVPPLFPVNNGQFTLPDEPLANQLIWMMEQFSANDTSIADINAHFSSQWLNQISASETRDFIQTIRSNYQDAIIIDLMELTPMTATVLIQGQNQNTGILTLSSFYSGGGLIYTFGVNNHTGNLQYPEDMNLTLAQAITKFDTFAADTGLLIAYINDDNQCEYIAGHQTNQLLATGSVFKAWVLGGFAQAVENNTLSINQNVNYVASERVYNTSPMHRESFGTPFKALDLATLMMGVSDNTATDHVHELAGRNLIDQYISNSGANDPDVLSPILSVNEQFHLFFSFPFATSQDYINDTEANQLNFINNQIVPLGPVSAFPYSNMNLLTTGSWRASPMDICANMAKLRQFPKGSDALYAVDRAYGAQAAQYRVRPHWDRVWYKGGSLTSGSTGYHVLTHGWLLENNGQWPIVLIAMTNDSNGGIDDDLGIYKIQSVLAKILELLAEGI